MLNDSPTLLDTSVVAADPSTVVVSDDGGLIAGRYRLLRPLGEGGMGNVYLANDLILERQVAVKTIRPELSGNDEVRARIKRECRLHAAIGAHPNIVTLYDTVEENGHIYLVMEYFAGETLAARLAVASGSQRLPLYLALDIVRQILQALACIHGRDIVHRDIKTSNILLQKQADGRYLTKLTDFGIARPDADPAAVTRLTSLATQGPGTPIYMAPERIDPQTYGGINAAADLYAVGVILYELLTGRPPFTGTMTEIFTGHLIQAPPLDALPSTLPNHLRSILRMALAKQPADRYQDAEYFLAALAEVEEREILLPEHAVSHEATVLAVEETQALPVIAEATVLNPAQGRPLFPVLRVPILKQPWLWVAAALVVLTVVGIYFLAKQPAVPTSSPTTSLDAPPSTTPSQSPPAATMTTPVSPPSLEESEQAKMGAALEAVEQARQQKSVEPPVTTTRTEAVSPAPRRTPSQPASRASEWEVTEDRTKKIH